MNRFFTVLGLVALASCSNARATREAPVSSLTAITRGPLSTLFARRIDPTRSSLSLPGRSDEPVWIAVPGAAPVGVRALGESRPLRWEDRVGRYDGIAPSTDVAWFGDGEHVEVLHVLRDAQSPGVASWAFEPGAGRSVRVREDRIEIVEGERVVLGTAPVVAVDAHGRSHPMRLSITGSVVTASVDPASLTFPAVIDPLFSTVPAMCGARGRAVLGLLPDGRVLATAGGSTCTEAYDPKTNTWSTLPAANAALADATGAALADGRVVIVAGGAYQVFNPTTSTWSAKATGPACTGGCAVVRLAGGDVIAVASDQVTSVFVASTGTWITAPNAPNSSPTLIAPLKDGRLLAHSNFFGGVATAYYTRSTNSWATGPFYPVKSNEPRTIALDDAKGGVLEIGEYGGGGTGTGCYILDPSTGTWTVAPVTRDRRRPALARLPNGNVLIAGGANATTLFSDVEIGDLKGTTPRFVITEPFAAGHADMSTMVLGDGSVLLVGGEVAAATKWNGALRFTPKPLAAACGSPTGGAECASGYCVDSVCCSTSSCPSGKVCGSNGICASTNGATCTKDLDCAGNHCVDGVCCNTACTGACEACNIPGTLGTCSQVIGAPEKLGRKPCGDGSECGGTCNGTSRTTCTSPGSGTVCGTNLCAGGTEKKGTTCDGKGACNFVETPCGLYGCGAELCKRSCFDDTDCVASAYCAGDKCVPRPSLGAECSTKVPCPAGLFCTDGVCCEKATCGEGSSCATKDAKGTCKMLPGTACTTATECGTGFCVDGVCCASACDGVCEGCDVPGSKGSCVAITGAPRGSKTCGDSAEPCKAAGCDGVSRAECKGLRNVGKECAPARCEGEVLFTLSRCEADGTCPTGIRTSCGRYGCDAAALACRTTCSTTSDCAQGFGCVGGACVEAGRCTDGGATSTSPDGVITACAPYSCGPSGQCLTTCATSNDCAAGVACDAATSKCVGGSTEDSSGGCTLGRPSGHGFLGAFAGLILLGLVRRRRVA